jgi:hypothetical protein
MVFAPEAIFRSSSMVEHPAVNRRVASSSLACGAKAIRCANLVAFVFLILPCPFQDPVPPGLQFNFPLLRQTIEVGSDAREL